jgi:hypothetical protein
MTTDAADDLAIPHWTVLPTLWVVTDEAAATTLRAGGARVQVASLEPGAATRVLKEAYDLGARVLVVALPRSEAGNRTAGDFALGAGWAGLFAVVHTSPGSDIAADRDTIFIVPDPVSAEYLTARGARVHCTGGVLDPIDGIGPDRLALQVPLDGAERVVLLFPGTLEGQATALYLTSRLLEHETLEIVSLAGTTPG